MILPGGRALVALTLIGALSRHAVAQDTTAVFRHLLSLDVSKVRPFHRAYEMLTRGPDSAVVIGQRDLVLDSASYNGAPAWLLIETRTGVVAAVESLYIAPDLRPLHWSSVLGAARLGAEFVGDSIYGATTMQAGKQNLVVGSRPDLLVSLSMVELLIPLLPLTADWSDSAAVLGVDLTSSLITPARLAVVANLEEQRDSVVVRTMFVELSAEQHRVVFAFDAATGDVLSVRQPLPPQTGSELEYRLRPDPAAAPPLR